MNNKESDQLICQYFIIYSLIKSIEKLTGILTYTELGNLYSISNNFANGWDLLNYPKKKRENRDLLNYPKKKRENRDTSHHTNLTNPWLRHQRKKYTRMLKTYS